MSELLMMSISEHVCLLQINRFERKNALNEALYIELLAALEEAKNNVEVHVVVLTGVNDVFTAGNDLEEFAGAPTLHESSPVLLFLNALSLFPKPIVAAVNGIAVGIGTTMLLHCDLVYAADTAQFSLPFVRLGLVPEAASTLLLPKRCGHLRASELLFFGGMFNADDALELNLVNKIVLRNELMEYVLSQAKRLASAPQSAVVETKRLLKLADSSAVEQQLHHEAESFIQLIKTPYAQAQFANFLKRK